MEGGIDPLARSAASGSRTMAAGGRVAGTALYGQRLQRYGLQEDINGKGEEGEEGGTGAVGRREEGAQRPANGKGRDQGKPVGGQQQQQQQPAAGGKKPPPAVSGGGAPLARGKKGKQQKIKDRYADQV